MRNNRSSHNDALRSYSSNRGRHCGDSHRADDCVVLGRVEIISRNLVTDTTYAITHFCTCSVPARIACPNRIIEAVAVPVRADARFGDLPPVRLEEHPEFGVVVAGVEVLEAGVGVEALTDPAFGLALGG